jgi:hypothetical protein
MANHPDEMSHHHTMRVPRSRGAVSGVLLIVLGGWGALVAFVGPYFHYRYASDATWKWTAARFWFEVLPGAATALGGLVLLIAANRVAGSIAGWLSVAGGVWFVIGRDMSPILHAGSVGEPVSSTNTGRVVEALGFFSGLGVAIAVLAAFALGRMAVVAVRDVRAAQDRDRRQADRDTDHPIATADATPAHRAGPTGDHIEDHPSEDRDVTARQQTSVHAAPPTEPGVATPSSDIPPSAASHSTRWNPTQQ